MFDKSTGEILLYTLSEWGVDHVYGLPGDSINHFVDNLRSAEDRMRFIQVRHEEVGALSAASYAKITGKIGVCLSIAGPGAIHLLNGLYDAKADGVPVLVIAGQVDSTQLGTDQFQEVNLEKMFDDVSVFNKRVQSAETLPDLANQAIRTAVEKKGVAILTIPDDLAAEKVKQKVKNTSLIHSKAVIHPDNSNLQDALQLLNDAKRPVILAGKGAKHSREELLQFAEKIAAPVILSLPGKGTIPDVHPYNLGQLGQIGTKPAYEAMEETDLLIMVGTSFPYRDYLPDDAKAIQLDIEPTQIGKRYPITVGLIGDAKWTLSYLAEHCHYQEDRDFIEKCQENMKNWWTHLEKIEAEKSSPIKPQEIMPQLQKVVDDDAILSVDVGNVTVWTTRHFRVTNQTFILSSWMATMGCGLPGAIAAKIAHPERQAVAICGDGGFSMVMQDFLTAVKYQLPMMVVLFNNERLGMIKYEQHAIGNLDYETELKDFDYAAFARTAGGEGYRVEKHEELLPAFERAAKSTKPVIVDIMIEDQAPLPGKVTYEQASSYSKYMLKKAFEEQELDMPPLKKALKRIF
ncbi:pyruvate oxidase [Alkalihalobacillus sp. CinArs1]|uniref:pyruvate oxidase n=1 Tax=Alkalihalobacillus sp. CinArs1 TaxID=2995314 RepID=UPI0022DD96F1|nr:pyruvate oxidase [Alkalihalobacillus sp. CinArs1]